MVLNYLRRNNHDDDEVLERRIEPRLSPELRGAQSEVFDSGRKTIVDCAHVKVERLDTRPVLFSKVFKEFEDWKGQKYDYRYWAERENFFLREFLKKQNEFTHVVQARHLISENEAAGVQEQRELIVARRKHAADPILKPTVPVTPMLAFDCGYWCSGRCAIATSCARAASTVTPGLRRPTTLAPLWLTRSRMNWWSTIGSMGT